MLKKKLFDFIDFRVIIACLVVGLLLLATRVKQPLVVSCTPRSETPTHAPPFNPVNARDFMSLGDYEYDRGNCDQAISAYSQALVLDPNLAQAYNNRAYTYMVMRQYDKALPDLDKAVELRPDYINALMSRGDIYNFYYAIDFERAVADYDLILKLDPHAMRYTSVCGHRLLALNHGWSLNVLWQVARQGVQAGCP